MLLLKCRDRDAAVRGAAYEALAAVPAASLHAGLKGRDWRGVLDHGLGVWAEHAAAGVHVPLAGMKLFVIAKSSSRKDLAQREKGGLRFAGFGAAGSQAADGEGGPGDKNATPFAPPDSVRACSIGLLRTYLTGGNSSPEAAGVVLPSSQGLCCTLWTCPLIFLLPGGHSRSPCFNCCDRHRQRWWCPCLRPLGRAQLGGC